jgi:glycosyltransferase involved in cell wall biosynthesis
MAAPLISVVIPAYNHERFIGKAIDSVLNQTVDYLELIIVDDGSTDRTAEVIKNYTDSRLSYTWQENQDAYNTINRGMSMAKGKYISILNSDDIYTTNRFEKILAHIDGNASDCVITDVIPISDGDEEFTDVNFGWNQWHQKNRGFYHQVDDLYTGFLNGNFMVTTSNLFMTADAVTKVGDFAPIRYLHDYDYIFRLMLAFPNSVHYLDNAKLLYYRIHDGNTLSEAAITGREQDLEVIGKYMIARVPDNLKPLVQTGSDRLRQLENEISDVKLELSKPRPGVATPTPTFCRRVKNKLCRMFCH